MRASLTYATTTGDQLRERVQQVLVDEWKAIGVEVKIQNQPSSVILSGSCTGKDPRKLGTFDLLMYASTPSIDPHSTILPRYHSKQIPTQADCSGQNYTRFKNPDADKAIEEAGSTLDIEKRKAAYAKVMKALNDAYVIIWMYDRANIDARVDGQRTHQRSWRTVVDRAFIHGTRRVVAGNQDVAAESGRSQKCRMAAIHLGRPGLVAEEIARKR